ncbi:MAG TPA: isochorismatase family cysteine hydrolase [Bacillota bacterium]
MQLSPKNEFIQKCTATLEELYETLSKLPKLSLADLPAPATVLVLMDLINGFSRTGALQSPRVEALIPETVRLIKACDQRGIAKIAFADQHSEASPEFTTYPVHCLAGTGEAEVVAEIKELGGYRLISKNSTNGFLEAEFQNWLQENTQITDFIVVGDCTDICIQQFVITLKAWFNGHNQKVRVIVPTNLVDTYDLGIHNAELLNAMALYNMLGNGVEVVQKIELATVLD